MDDNGTEQSSAALPLKPLNCGFPGWPAGDAQPEEPGTPNPLNRGAKKIAERVTGRTYGKRLSGDRPTVLTESLSDERFAQIQGGLASAHQQRVAMQGGAVAEFSEL